MGINDTFESDTSWQRAVELLDQTFPLTEGSHSNACDYVVHFDHLLVIGSDGRCTGLARPAQFVEVGGNEEAPQSVVLEQDGLQVEIELDRSGQPASCCPEHRVQLRTTTAAA